MGVVAILTITVIITVLVDIIWPLGLIRGVGTGPATAGPMFPEPTIKNIIPLFVIKEIKNFMLQLHIYTILIKELH